VVAKAVLVEAAEFVIVQRADDDEEGEDGVDRGHGKAPGSSPRALERAAVVRKGWPPQVGRRRGAAFALDPATYGE
jgi:hypothetical protein